MKTTVSIPDQTFIRAERLAAQLGWSRGDLYSQALKEYIERHASEDVTEAMNRVCDQNATRIDAHAAAVARRVLEHTDW